MKLHGLEGHKRLKYSKANDLSWRAKGAQMFRRGGEVDVQKRNVIVDGPSHEEGNETNIAGDKGIPVVMDGKKIIEIESKELVLHEEAMAKIHALKLRVEKGDDTAKVELHDLIKHELLSNTYDYTKELL
jgi:hypothetical protein